MIPFDDGNSVGGLNNVGNLLQQFQNNGASDFQGIVNHQLPQSQFH